MSVSPPAIHLAIDTSLLSSNTPSSPPSSTRSSKKKHSKRNSGSVIGGSQIHRKKSAAKKTKKKQQKSPSNNSSSGGSNKESKTPPSAPSSPHSTHDNDSADGVLSDNAPSDQSTSPIASSSHLRLPNVLNESGNRRIQHSASDSGSHLISPRRRRSLSQGSEDYPSQLIRMAEKRKLKRESGNWNLRPRDAVCITVSNTENSDCDDDENSEEASPLLTPTRKLASSQGATVGSKIDEKVLRRRASTVKEGKKGWKALMDEANNNSSEGTTPDGTPKQVSAWKRKMHMGNQSLGPLLALVAQSGSDVEADKLFAELMMKEGNEADYGEMREELSASMRQRKNQKLKGKGSIIDENFYQSSAPLSPSTQLRTPSSEELNSTDPGSARKRRGSFRRTKDKETSKEKKEENKKDKEKEKEKKRDSDGGFRFSLLSSRKQPPVSPTSSMPVLPLSPNSKADYSESAELKVLQRRYEDEVARRVRAENEVIALKALLASAPGVPHPGLPTNASAPNLLSPPLKRTTSSRSGSTISRGRWKTANIDALSLKETFTNKRSSRTSVVVVVNPDEFNMSEDDMGVTDDGDDCSDDDSSYGGTPQQPSNEPQLPPLGKKIVMSFSGDLRSVLAPSQFKRIAQMSRSRSMSRLMNEDTPYYGDSIQRGAIKTASNNTDNEDEDQDFENVNSGDVSEEEGDEELLILRESQPVVNVIRRTKSTMQRDQQRTIQYEQDVELAFLRRTVEKQKQEIDELEKVLSKFVGS